MTSTGIEAARFAPFELEEWQSRYEHEVDYNLADSGVEPVVLKDLLSDDAAVNAFLASDLHYPKVNGTNLLRDRIAGLYGPDVSRDEVLVTVGAAEANSLAVTTLTRPGDHVVVLEPGYRQVAGVALNHGCRVEAFHLIEEQDWRPDLDELQRVVSPDTRLIAVNNPNNPTGAILSEAEMTQIVAIADSVGAWILADEVYHGTEIDGSTTPTFYGRTERVVVTNSLSKAYGLSGTRVGWTISDRSTTEEMWRRHEYSTISTSNLSMILAEIALTPSVRAALFVRNRNLINAGLARFTAWAESTDGLVSVVAPRATALIFPRINVDLPSLDIAQALRRSGVLVAVGSHFGVEGHLRVTHALEAGFMEAALARVGEALTQLTRHSGTAPS